MRQLFAALLLVCFSLSIFAQTSDGVIQGVALDPQDRLLPNVTIEILPTSVRAVTDARGDFRFAGVAPGVYTLRATADGFEMVEMENVTVSATTPVTIRFTQIRASMNQIDVVGEDLSALEAIPGSVSMITSRELEASHSFDANEVLRRVAGVHVREDSGPVGMRLNIGIRGLNPDRSRQVLVLEDGLPLALAPYGEPEMYYSPPIERMRRVEILKGSGQILYGPQTIGGVVNFVTPDPPADRGGALEIVGGGHGFFAARGNYGGTIGNFGGILSFLHKRGDGFRDFHFDINDVTAKFNYTIGDRQVFGAKINLYREDSNSTYLGLTQPQFGRNPNENAVPNDLLVVRRYFGSLNHRFIFNPDTTLNTTAFTYHTMRNWRRQDFDRARNSSRRYVGVFGDETIPGGAVFLRDSAGNRNREFIVAGIESRLAHDYSISGNRSRFDGGARYLYERARDRFIVGATAISSDGVLRDDEVRPAHAVSLFAQNRFSIGDRFTITPGLRLERYDYERRILRTRVGGVPTDVDRRGRDRVFEFIPGIGATFQLTDNLTVFGGAHRGFAPPRVKDAVNSSGSPIELDAELSFNYEFGARYRASRGFNAEATMFVLDFENQIIPASQSGGATSTLINAGQTLHRGAEFAAGFDFGRFFRLRSNIVAEGRYTYLPTARFENGIFQGNRLPYAPENNFSVIFGYRRPGGFGAQLDGTRVGSQFADNRETVQPSADGQIGLIPAYTVWNLSIDYERRFERYSIQPFVTIKNLTDRTYISSRAPEGIQPGLFRQANVGVRFGF